VIYVNYKIISIGNQWVISRVENNDSEIVGKIITKSNNSTTLFFETQEINLTSRVIGESILFSIKTKDLNLNSYLRMDQKGNLIWKQEKQPNDSFKCTKHKNLFYLKQANQTIAKVKAVTNQHFILKINQANKLPNAIILACFFPFFN